MHIDLTRTVRTIWRILNSLKMEVNIFSLSLLYTSYIPCVYFDLTSSIKFDLTIDTSAARINTLYILFWTVWLTNKICLFFIFVRSSSTAGMSPTHSLCSNSLSPLGPEQNQNYPGQIGQVCPRIHVQPETPCPPSCSGTPVPPPNAHSPFGPVRHLVFVW